MAFEVINEIGFALVAPISLSLFSRAAPRQIQGLMIGVYYLTFFLCNLTVGYLGALLERVNAANFWLLHATIVGAAAALLAMIAMWGRHLLSPSNTHES
jgi:POT family proton-dependent oligopeptide transporter